MSFDNPQDFYKSLQQFSNNIGVLRDPSSTGSTNDKVTKLIEQAGKKYILENSNKEFVDEIKALDETLGDNFNEWLYGESEIAKQIRDEVYLSALQDLYVNAFYIGCNISTLAEIASDDVGAYLDGLPAEDLYASDPENPDALLVEALSQTLPEATQYAVENPNSNTSNVVNSDGNLSMCNL